QDWPTEEAGRTSSSSKAMPGSASSISASLPDSKGWLDVRSAVVGSGSGWASFDLPPAGGAPDTSDVNSACFRGGGARTAAGGGEGAPVSAPAERSRYSRAAWTETLFTWCSAVLASLSGKPCQRFRTWGQMSVLQPTISTNSAKNTS